MAAKNTNTRTTSNTGEKASITSRAIHLKNNFPVCTNTLSAGSGFIHSFRFSNHFLMKLAKFFIRSFIVPGTATETMLLTWCFVSADRQHCFSAPFVSTSNNNLMLPIKDAIHGSIALLPTHAFFIPCWSYDLKQDGNAKHTLRNRSDASQGIRLQIKWKGDYYMNMVTEETV